MLRTPCLRRFFFFNDTATTEIYTLSLHDALPIYQLPMSAARHGSRILEYSLPLCIGGQIRSEEHTSELQSLTNLVCRLLLEKKKKRYSTRTRASALLTQSLTCALAVCTPRRSGLC